MPNIFQRIGDVAFDVMKGVGAGVALINPALGGAIAGGGILLDRLTDWDKKQPGAATAQAMQLAGIQTPGVLPTAQLGQGWIPQSVEQNIPMGSALEWGLGKILGPKTGGVAPSMMAPRPGALPTFPTGQMRGPLAAQVPQQAEFLKQFQLPQSAIRLVPRAPAGYVILYDAAGQPFAILKQIARAFKLWRPKQKPPISVRDWNALKRGARTVNKMKKVVKLAKTVGTRRKSLAF